MDFPFYGWSPTEENWTWSEQRTALLAFRPLPLPAGATGVDLVITAWSFQPSDKSDLQSVSIQLNGAMLATLLLPPNRPNVQPVQVRITSAQWQDALAKNEGRLQFYFPAAQSPYHLGMSNDRRMLGGGFRSIEFRPVFAPMGEAPTVPR